MAISGLEASSRKAEFYSILRLLAVPLLVISLFLLLTLAERFFHFSLKDSLVLFMKERFEQHGYWLIFLSALIEGVLILGEYYPGGFIIFVGVVSAGKDISRVSKVVLTVSLAFLIAYHINYLVGKHGWYKLFLRFKLQEPLERAQKRLSKHAFNAIMLSYWEPNLASVTATAAGILQVPLRRFFRFSLFSILVWNAIWGALVYSLGEAAIQALGKKYILGVLTAWFLFVLVKALFNRKHHQKIVSQISEARSEARAEIGEPTSVRRL